mmetsp:Transcript_10303/g.15594  ORF Transcript_10303/g.15594 Transcript_10303/m.15594 type:complete len:602 (+) Transcript_10303:55-1860(+)
MAPSIDEYVSPGPSRGPGAGDDRDGSTTEVIMAERMAENEHRKRESMQMLPQMMHGLSFNVFGVEKLRAEQMVALQRCADPQFNDSKLLLVTRTGSGKSHVTRTLGVMMNGITVIFVPLLSLSADQMKKMEEAKQCFGSVETHHCDELPTDDGGIALQKIVTRVKELDDTTTSTIFLFASPQFLCNKANKPLLDELLSAHKRKILRVVAVDEAHLHVQHSSFRVEILMLRDLFFKKVFNKDDPRSHPVFFAMTATMPKQYIPRLVALTNVQLSRDNIFRGNQKHFSQHNIQFGFKVRDSFNAGLDRLVGVITNTITNEHHEESERVVVLTTLAYNAITLEKTLTEKLNKAGCGDADVVLVHGQQNKMVKFDGMRNFCGKKEFAHFNPRILVTNGAGNTGIDSDKVTEILRAGVPMDLPTVLQERGRLVRKEGMNGFITFIFNLRSLLQCLHLLHGLHTKEEDSATEQNTGFGSAIRHSALLLSKEEKKSKTDDSYTQLKKECMREIENGTKSLEEEKIEMLLEVLQFFCLEQGCLHARAEEYLSTGKLHKIDPKYKCNKRRSVVLAYPADCFSASIGAMVKVSTVLKSSRRAEFKSGLYLR